MASATALRLELQQTLPIHLDVSLHCESGELLALVGPSGSGKSTVLRTIAGLNKPTHGSITCGKDIWLDTTLKKNLRIQARRVGFVFQHYALFPNKTALDNVALAVTGTRSDKRTRALSWLEKTNMTGLENRKPAELSGGQRQRVALARALARNPSVLLLDEPFSAVDQQTRRRLYRELARIRLGLNIPMILVTHDINEVQQLADSLCLIHRGKSLQQGSVQSVIKGPSSKPIAKLLGHQNLINAKVHEQTRHETIYRLDGNELLHGPKNEAHEGHSATLLISPTAISIANSQASQNTLGNRLQGTVSDCVAMGDEWSLRLHLTHVPKALRFRVPQHTIAGQAIEPGASITVSIIKGGIHAILETQNGEPKAQKM